MTLMKKEKEQSVSIKRNNIKDSPFECINIGDEYFVVCGKYRLTDIFKSEEEAIGNIEPKTWNNIIKVCLTILQIKDK